MEAEEAVKEKKGEESREAKGSGEWKRREKEKEDDTEERGGAS